jgi:drug/metabolite transporter (DMT)-like permease
MLGYVLLTQDQLLPRGQHAFAAISVIGVFTMGMNSLLFVGQQFVSGSVSAVLTSLSPVVTAVLAWLVLPQDRPTAMDSVGVFFGFLGVVCIVQPTPSTLFAPTVLGKGVILLTVVAFAIGAVTLRRLSPDAAQETLTAWGLVLGGVITHVMSAVRGEQFAATTWATTAIGALVIVAVLGTAAAYAVYFYLLAELGAVQVSLVTYTSPLVAVAIGVLFLNEAISLLTVVGFAFVVVAFALLKYESLQTLVD